MSLFQFFRSSYRFQRLMRRNKDCLGMRIAMGFRLVGELYFLNDRFVNPGMDKRGFARWVGYDSITAPHVRCHHAGLFDQSRTSTTARRAAKKARRRTHTCESYGASNGGKFKCSISTTEIRPLRARSIIGYVTS